MKEDPRHQYHPLAIAGIIEETADARSFVLDVPEHLAELFRYSAGQFLTFRVPWNGMVLQRCYSLAGSPEWQEALKVTVKRVEAGRVSNWFNDTVRVGDPLQVLPPEGRFVLRESEQPLVLFGGGSGITPLISLIKSALRSTPRRIHLVYANGDRDSIIFREELEQLGKQHPERLEIVHHLDVDRGFLDVGGAKEHIAGFEDAEFYLCGPDLFMQAVEDALEAVGVERSRVLVERFVSPTDPDRIEAAATPAPISDEVPERIVIRLDGAEHQVPYSAGKTLLESAREAGLSPPFACEEGYCSTCMARLKRGNVSLRVNDALTERDLELGFILTCQGVPSGPECEIDWDDV